MVTSDIRIELENMKACTQNLTCHLLGFRFSIALPRGHLLHFHLVHSMYISTLKGKSKNTLTLKEKVEVIKVAAGSRVGVRSLAEQLNCGRTQISKNVALNPLVSLFYLFVARGGRNHSNRWTDKPSTVTLAVHGCRGLIKNQSLSSTNPMLVAVESA